MLSLSVLIIITLGLTLIGTLALVWVARLIQRGERSLKGTEDVEGFYITVIGTLYAIFVAFMIFVVWSRYNEAAENAEQEADTLATINRLAITLPEPLKTEVRQSCLEYAHIAIEDDWPAMAAGESSPKRSAALMHKMWGVFASMKPDTVNDEVVRDTIIKQFIQLTAQRRLRLLQSRTSLPGILYFVLIFGGILVVAFAAAFPAKNIWTHAAKACVMAVLISVMLLTVKLLDYPFQGQVHVSPEAFERTLELMESYQQSAVSYQLLGVYGTPEYVALRISKGALQQFRNCDKSSEAP